jgi:hypothetical protein
MSLWPWLPIVAAILFYAATPNLSARKPPQ